MSRYRLHRAGILNVWQYDDQVFDLGEGRMLLRGTNGAGKSKTLELLLPYCLDGDNARMNASGTANSLLWLMFDGYDDTLRVGYVWVELVLRHDDGTREFVTCGVGLRGSQSAKKVGKWMFTTSRRVGIDLDLEGPDGPLSESALAEALGADGQVFSTVRDYRAHIARRLFGLDAARYDDLLRLLYWLRQPQVGEDIEPARLAHQLGQSLPEIDHEEIERAGTTLDELAGHGEQLERTRAARDAVAGALATYRRYARQLVRGRALELVAAADEDRRLARAARSERHRLDQLETELAATREQRQAQADASSSARAELDALGVTPDEARLDDLRRLAEQAEQSVARQVEAVDAAQGSLDRARSAQVRQRGVAFEQARERDDEGGGIATAARALSLVLPAGFAAAGAAESAVGAPDPEPATVAWQQAHGGAVRALQAAATARRAVVEQVQGLAREHAAAARDEERATRAEEEAAARADAQRARHADARESAVRVAQAWLELLRGWAADPGALELAAVAAVLDLAPDELADSEAGGELAGEVAGQSRTELDRRRSDAASAELARARLAEHRAQLQAELEQVRSARDPAPPPAQLARDRDVTALPGTPFWRAVDFRPGVPPADQAALEAALQQSGLLDAWLDPDGSVRAAGHDDVLLVAGPPVAGDSLASVLVAQDAAPYAAAVLASIALREDAENGDEPVAVGRDGSFRLGSLTGRATKPAAQYVGAAAREAERTRRIAELEARLAELAVDITAAEVRASAAQAAVASLEEWLRRVPSLRELDRAQAAVTAAHDQLRRLEAEAAEAERRAAALRSRAALALRAVTDAAEEHAVPADPVRLDSLLGELGDLTRAMARHVDRLGSLITRARELAEATAQVAAADAAHAEATRDLTRLQSDAASARAAYHAFAEALTDTLDQLERRRGAARRSLDEATAAEQALGEQVESLSGAVGSVRQKAAETAEAHERHGALLAACGTAVAGLGVVRGLLDAAAGELDDAAARALASGATDGLVPLARTWATWDGEDFDDNTLIRVADELKTGPAASYAPALVREHDAYAMVAEHQSRTVPLVDLDVVLTEKVEQDEALLTEHERRVFEEVMLGSLGDQLRSRLQESQELVQGMNELLADVRTSQGIRVKLRWRLRDDVPAEAQEVARLVVRSGAALTPDERDRLTGAMSRLVDLAADDAPEDGYQVHLQRALDYRTWHEFRVQYARPGSDWLDLTKRSPLSQGEQKVACYLPLFAAAAAHFSSVAGAAKTAPRFVLLDDAFPKIDARTHPALFGLLVDLDLDFVVTSERLWGDHPEVPRLEIYEALRSPGEPGIAHAHYSWDGRTLHSVDA